MVGFPGTLSPHTYSPTTTAPPVAAAAGDASAAGDAPGLDERFVMGSSHAGRILRRLRSPSPPMDEGYLWPSAPKPPDPTPSLLWTTDPISYEAPEPHETPMGACLLSWGSRRRVRYFERGREAAAAAAASSSSEPRYMEAPPPSELTYVEFHREAPSSEPSSSIAEGEEAEAQQIEGGRSSSSSPKRKKSKKRGRREKRPRADEKKKVEVEGEEEKRGSGSKVERWSAERYVAAELKLVEVMKEMGAGLGSPILRQRLRDEARRHIGDTGLLDHLLKHMVGKVVTGGGERFRRQHNVAGELEYWLEPADLAEIRRKAGVVDPYWVPPPGWKLGDPTSSCPCSAECQQEMSRLREEISSLKRVIEQLQKKDRDSQLEADKSYDAQQWVCEETDWIELNKNWIFPPR